MTVFCSEASEGRVDYDGQVHCSIYPSHVLGDPWSLHLEGTK